MHSIKKINQQYFHLQNIFNITFFSSLFVAVLVDNFQRTLSAAEATKKKNRTSVFVRVSTLTGLNFHIFVIL